jgi:FkbM family methyltransferase
MASLSDLNYVVGSIWRDESNRDQRLRRLSCFVGWQLWKRLVRAPIIIDLSNGLRFIAYPDCGVSAGFIYRRIPDYREISFLRLHLDGGALVDVGANVGSVSLQLADQVDHALLFEPNPIAAGRARENLRLNDLPFEVHEVALSDVCQDLELEDAGGVDTCNRTVAGFKTSLPTRKVTGLTFDQFLAKRRRPLGPVGLIKIDVEGHENAVLRGMKCCLSSTRPRLIMFEYLARTNLSETLDILGGVGYRVFRLGPEGAIGVTRDAAPLQNLFACPDELSSTFDLRLNVRRES